MPFPTKNLLNNPWVIATLCLVAGGMVYMNVAPPMFSDAAQLADANVDTEDWLVVEEQIQGTRYKLRAVDAIELTWNASPQRDPFTFAGTPAAAATIPDTAETTQKAPSQPRLTALVAGTDSRLAVVDGRIVAEGDSVSGHRVRQITPQGVLLETPRTQNIFLTVN
jgi:hypothetical protein